VTWTRFAVHSPDDYRHFAFDSFRDSFRNLPPRAFDDGLNVSLADIENNYHSNLNLEEIHRKRTD